MNGAAGKTPLPTRIIYSCDHCQIAWSNKTPNPTKCHCGREGRDFVTGGRTPLTTLSAP